MVNTVSASAYILRQTSADRSGGWSIYSTTPISDKENLVSSHKSFNDAYSHAEKLNDLAKLHGFSEAAIYWC